MSRIGKAIAGFDEHFEGFHEDALEITNYEDVPVETDPDEFDSPDEKQATADSPIETTGQVDLGTMSGEGSPWGRDATVDVEIYVPADITISDGEVEGLPYSSDVTHPATGQTYRIVDFHDEGNGRLRCAAVTGPER